MKSPHNLRGIAYLSILILLVSAFAPSTSGQSLDGQMNASAEHMRETISTDETRVDTPESPGAPPPAVFRLDDGQYEFALGFNNGNPDTGTPPTRNWQIVFANRFTPDEEDYPVTLDKVSILFPATDSNLVAGMGFELLVYLGPSGTSNAANTQLVVRQPISIQPSDTMFQEIALDTPVRVESGDIWVGFTNTYTRGHEDQLIYPGALDVNGSARERTWFFANLPQGSNVDAINFDGGTSLAQAQRASILDQDSRFGGNWMIRASGQSGATVELTWEAPDPNAGPEAPPRFLQAETLSDPAAAAKGTVDAPSNIVGYKIYRSNTSPVTPSPNNIFASVPPNQTSARSSTAQSGSFFVVTACYASGAESSASNEASGGIPGPAITSVKVNSKKVVGNGTGWVFPVTVFFDNVGFTSPTKVKNKPNFIRVTQKGRLENGQSISNYLQPGREVLITFRNSNGATTAIPVVVQ
jgi:hypothetical protein